MQELCILCGSHKTRTTIPPESDGLVEGAVLADVVSVGSVGSTSESRVDCPNASGGEVTSAPLSSAVIPVCPSVLRVDVSCALHPFFVHKLDSGPIQLMTIAHAFNYRVAVLRDGVWLAIRVGRFRKAAVMFQIVSTLVLEVPAFFQFMHDLLGESPNVQLCSEPWGHVDHCDDNCGILCTWTFPHDAGRCDYFGRRNHPRSC